MPVRPSLPSLSTAAEAATGADLAAAVVFMAGAVGGSTVEEAVVAFMAAEEVSVAGEDSVVDTGRPRLVTELLMLVHRCVQGADTHSGLETVIPAIPARAVILPVGISGSETPRRLRRPQPMAGGIRFLARVEIVDRQARHRKPDAPRTRADYTSIMAAADPDLPGRLGAFRATATEFGKTRPPLVT